MLELVEGNRRRRTYGAKSLNEERLLDREMHSAFTQVHGEDGTVPSDAIYDVRRGLQKPWRYLGRRLREMRDAGTDIEQAKEIVRVLDLFVDHLYGEA